jgi:hypothetical protein
MPPILSGLNSDLHSQKQKLEASLNNNKVGLGWLRFTCSVKDLTHWRESIKDYFSVELLPRGKGWNGYLESLQGSYSILIAYTPSFTQAERLVRGIKASPNEGLMTVDIPQSALDSLSGVNLLKLWLDVYGCEGLNLTRVDVYYDDYCKLISPEELHNGCKRGGVGVPQIRNIRGWDEYDLQEGVNKGYTVYFGSNRSSKQIRYYDKFAESGGRQDCYRLEVQLSGDSAKAFQDWFSDAFSESLGLPTLDHSLTAIANAYKRVLKGSISFHEIPVGTTPRELEANWVSRTPYTWWWKELLAGLEPAKLVIERRPPSLAGTVNWIRQQVMPGLALLRSVYQNWGILFGSWLDRELEQGEERWSERHFNLLKEALITSPAT